MFKKSVPDGLVGLWRRLFIEEDGQKDTTSQVYWLQTSSSFGDIRIPAGRPQVQSPEAVTQQQALALAEQDGFAGVTHLTGLATGHPEGKQCEWNHAMDYQPFKGQMDTGTLYWQESSAQNEGIGDILVEVGPDGSYVEEWQRVATGATSALTLSDGGGWQSWLVVCGDYFIYMHDARSFLPASHTLSDLILGAIESDRSKTSSLAQMQKYLNCEISLGRCQQGQQPWEITLSTLPWKEGQSLWSLTDIEVDVQSEQVMQTVDGKTLTWTVQEWGSLSDLLALNVSIEVA